MSRQQEGHLVKYVRYSLSIAYTIYLFKIICLPVERVSLQEVISRIKNGENLEVLGYEGDVVLIDKVKGIVKGEFSQEELSELKKRKPRGKPTKEQLELAAEVAKLLGEAKKVFKIVCGPREVTIRVGTGFIRVVDDGVKLAGYRSLEDDPLPLIINTLRKYGNVKLLRPLK